MRKLLIMIAAAGIIASCCNSQPQTDGTNAAIENIMNRKSVRSFTGQQVPQDMMNTMLKAAMAAPSGVNRQPWSFVVVNDTAKFASLFEGNFNLRTFKSAGTVVVICADTTMAGSDPQTRVLNELWRDDMGACTENFLLAAEALGLGAVWTAGYPHAERMGIKEKLGMPEHVIPYCMVAVGYPATDEAPKDKYKPERIHWNKW